jgi:hypothetical protein
MAPWDPYRIRSGDGVEMDIVRHVAHVPTARRIIEDGRIKSGLIYDKSVLNRSRISVVWLSANTWAYGSMYGTVQFDFPWTEIVAGQNIYWVEAITDYNPTAFRMLLSERDVSSSHLHPYDPTKDDGPLRFRDGKWSRAGHLTSEFMIEDDIPLRRSTGLDFVEHHPKYCNLNGSGCEDIRRRQPTQRSAARVLAQTLSHGDHSIDRLWKPEDLKPVFTPLETGYSGLVLDLTHRKVEFGGPLKRPESCGRVVAGALALYADDRLTEARDLLSLVQTRDHLERALLKTIRQHFDDRRWKPDR